MVIVVIAVILAFAWYRIVKASEAHYVVGNSSEFVASPNKDMCKRLNEKDMKTKRAYFHIPSFIPFFGREVRVMDITIKELVIEQETYEKNQARYQVKSSIKYRVDDPVTAANSFISNEALKPQLVEVIRASVRAVTVKYDVVDARAEKKSMEEKIRAEMTDDLMKWGLQLVNFQLVDFQDTKDSAIISDISKRREKEIEATTRERNAEKEKSAKIKEAESDEKSQQREIERDQRVGEQKQLRDQKVSEQEKIAKEKAYAVIQVETIRQAEIDKEKAKIEALQKKEVAEVIKEEQRAYGEGERLKLQEIAKGDAAEIREAGFAEAEALEKKQAALNKFSEGAIRALTAEQVVTMQKEVGIASAAALKEADVKVFAGDGEGKSGFDLGKLISAVSVSNDATAEAALNRIARPNDLGLSAAAYKTATDVANANKKDTKKK